MRALLTAALLPLVAAGMPALRAQPMAGPAPLFVVGDSLSDIGNAAGVEITRGDTIIGTLGSSGAVVGRAFPQ